MDQVDVGRAVQAQYGRQPAAARDENVEQCGLHGQPSTAKPRRWSGWSSNRGGAPAGAASPSLKPSRKVPAAASSLARSSGGSDAKPRTVKSARWSG
ncbi:hypothetical protein V2I01_42530 [Micromonospora sp. BRA006-A]|nr:hypothetical protein [Micromonospora sp. BRA006-A]